MHGAVVPVLIVVAVAIALAGIADSYAQVFYTSIPKVVHDENGKDVHLNFVNRWAEPVAVRLTEMYDQDTVLASWFRTDHDASRTITIIGPEPGSFYLMEVSLDGVTWDGRQSRAWIYHHPDANVNPHNVDVEFIKDPENTGRADQIAVKFSNSRLEIYYDVNSPSGRELQNPRGDIYLQDGQTRTGATITLTDEGTHTIRIYTSFSTQPIHDFLLEYTHPNDEPTGAHLISPSAEGPLSYALENKPPRFTYIAEAGRPNNPIDFTVGQPKTIRVGIVDDDFNNTLTVTTTNKRINVTETDREDRVALVFTPNASDYPRPDIVLTVTDQDGDKGTTRMHARVSAAAELVHPELTARPGQQLFINVSQYITTDPPDVDFVVTNASGGDLGQAEIANVTETRMVGNETQTDIVRDQAATYTAGNQTGTDEIEITVRIDRVSHVIRANVTISNEPPTAGTTSDMVPAGGTVDIDLSDFVSDPDGDPLTVSVPDTPALGTATANGTTVSYTAGAETGTDIVGYQVSDGHGGTANGTIAIIIMPNTPPEARDFAVTVASSGNVSVDLAAEGHISDAEQEAGTLSISVEQPAGGTVAVDGTTVTYFNAGTMGQDTISYTVSDVLGETATATITVMIPPDEPVMITANDDNAATDQDAPVTIDVLSNDMIESDVQVEVTIARDVGDGSTTVNANNTILYSPDAGYQGVDSFEYSISAGGVNDTATVTIVVGQVANTAPAAADFEVTVEPSGNVTVDLADAGHITDGEQSAGTLAVSLDASAAQGSATVQGAVFEYQANDNAAGTETIPYTVTDREGLTDSGTITVTITQAPPEPILQAPDIDVEAIPGTLTRVQPDIGAGNTITSATGATMGTITEGFLNLGTIAYTANAGESGIDGITYTVSDGAGGIAQGTVYFYINEQGNEKPVLEPIPGIQTEGTATFTTEATDDEGQLTYLIRNAPDGATMGNTTGEFSWDSTGSGAGDYIFNIVVHDDAGGFALQKMAITVGDPANENPTAPVVHRRTTLGTSILVTPDIRDPEGQPTSIILAVGAEGGTVREGFLEANIIAYVPDQTGTDIISYTTSDGAGGATTSTVYIHTGTSADPDLDVIGVQRVGASEALTFQVSATDGDSPDILYIMNGAPDGATLDEASGDFSWTPTASGDYTFTITAYDGQGGFDTEPVAIAVSEPGVPNEDPNVVDFDSPARQNNPRFIALQTSDPDDDPTDIVLATGATKGTIQQDSLQFGIITYVPDIGQTGTDEIDYVVSDGRGGASTGTIYVHVRDPDNSEPTLESVGIKQVDAPNELTFDVTATDSDEGDTLTFGIRNAPAGATIDNATGAFSWTPTTSDAGDHAFTVAVHDTGGGFATEDIIVTVTDPGSANQPPTASDESTTTTGSRVTVFPDIDDPDGDDLTIITTIGAVQGSVDAELLKDTIIAYTPFEGAFGTDTITYTVSDGRGGLATGTVTITINTP